MATRKTMAKEETKIRETKNFVPENNTAFYFVSPGGKVTMKRFIITAENLALVATGNCFKTAEEAKENAGRFKVAKV